MAAVEDSGRKRRETVVVAVEGAEEEAVEGHFGKWQKSEQRLDPS